jgi:hypothetical protein
MWKALNRGVEYSYLAAPRKGREAPREESGNQDQDICDNEKRDPHKNMQRYQAGQDNSPQKGQRKPYQRKPGGELFL